MFTSFFALTLAAALQNAPAPEAAKPAEKKPESTVRHGTN